VEWRLETLYKVFFYFEKCILSACTGGSNYELWWTQEGWNSLCSLLFLDGQLERLVPLFNAYPEWEDPVIFLNYGGSKGVEGVK
jgi:hypothetical protein